MAGNRGVTLFVLLLSCWHEAKLQPINMTSGMVTSGLLGCRNTHLPGAESGHRSFSLRSFPTLPNSSFISGGEWRTLNSVLSWKTF